MEKVIIIKVDKDNDIYELIVNGEVYDIYNIYESKYANLWDELNMAIEIC